MKITVKVTKDILERSKMCANLSVAVNAKKNMIGQNCAIGLAIYEIFGKRSWVAPLVIFIYKEEWEFKSIGNLSAAMYQIKLPAKASIFINQFDGNNPEERVKMTPISFEIDIPDKLIEEIGLKEVNKILQKSKTLEYVE